MSSPRKSRHSAAAPPPPDHHRHPGPGPAGRTAAPAAGGVASSGHLNGACNGPPRRKNSNISVRRRKRRRWASPPPKKERFDAWVFFARLATCCIPTVCIRGCDVPNVQAWREKLALCLIIFLLQSVVAFVTFGLKSAFCDDRNLLFPALGATGNPEFPYAKLGRGADTVTVNGIVYAFSDVRKVLRAENVFLSSNWGGTDMSEVFAPDSSADPCRPPRCSLCEKNLPRRYCRIRNPVDQTILTPPSGCLRLALLDGLTPVGEVTYDWAQLGTINGIQTVPLIVYNGRVLNVTDYFGHTRGARPNLTDPWFPVDSALRRTLGIDATVNMQATPDLVAAAECFSSRFQAGYVGTVTVGCCFAQVILMASLVVVLSTVLTRFIMAVSFSWFLSKGLVRNAPQNGGPPRAIEMSAVPGAEENVPDLGVDATERSPVDQRGDPLMYTMMLVTCYSEGAAGIRGTLDSLSATTYNDKYKMLFIVTDGIIKGAGETQSTPQLCLGMLDIAPELRNPAPRSYVAIADGEKQHNTAKVYAGWYRYKTRSVPAVLVVKCGTPKEVGGPKPGNRGKRDSQVMVMSFLSRVIFDDRMTEFDYDLFWKVQYLMGVTPDRFELVLMVDADTTVRPGSMSYMIKAMDKNPMIMGLCGETCIANKHDSWVTWIQVFEYHISHHLSKAFESVFGGVTCLPGCFSMYRIKARKNGAWVPILANPDVVQEYSQNEVETLHKKNLLLLGEDRFLSTLMLRNFPKRQMVFVPQAKCKTVVPSTFRVLLSQRRRWINSTVHNLLELVLVKDLCGIACLSMQFVVLVELLGTVLLPVAVVVAFALAATLIASPGPVEMMSLFVPAVVLGLPAVFVLTTSLKLEYIFWMLVYLVSLPVWNFVLPLYAFWHFDDFSWGQTRVVAGERGGPDRRRQHHGAKEGEFDTSAITMRRWSEWEVERRGALVANVLREHSPYFAAKRSSDVPLQDVPPLPAAV